MIKMRKFSKGFSLVETLVAISIFMMFLTVIMTSYISIIHANKAAAKMQALYGEVRNIFDALVYEARGGIFDYKCMDPALAITDPDCIENQNPADEKVLSMISGEGKSRTLFKFDAAAQQMLMQNQKQLPGGTWAPAEWQVLNSSQFPVEQASFYVFPSKNPYDAASAAIDEMQWQPSVTISLKMQNFTFKTTYSSRVYGKQSIYANL